MLIENPYDVIIVGAGYAGLVAARMLQDNEKKIKVLEARERVGGRVHTHYLDDDTYVDLGGQWIGPTQDKIYALAKEMGVSTFATYNQGKNIMALNQQIKKYEGLIPKIDIPSLLNIDFVLKKLEKLARAINVERPWKIKNARQLDSQTLATFLDKQVKFKNARKVLDAGLESVFACTPAEVSLLHVLFYIKSGTSLEHLLNIDNGAQQDRFVGGAQLVANKLAEQIKKHIHFNAPVRKVVQSENQLAVHTDDAIYHAKRIIIAIPPTLTGRIQFEPALPFMRDQLVQRIPMGIVSKCYAIYDKPFWRDKGMSGQAVTDEHYYLQTIFDNSPPDGSRGILMGFTLADRARTFMQFPEIKRKEIVIDTFKQFFGAEAGHPIYYIDKSWAEEPWSGGCYTGIFPTGTWTSFQDTLAKPCGRIHWAGTETATIWNGYIEGAIHSGERATKEILNLS